MKPLLPIVSMALLVPASALAQQQEEAQAKPLRPKIVCRAQTQTGSRVAQNICRTPEEWKEIDDRNIARAQDIVKRIDAAASTDIARPTASGPAQMGPGGISTSP